MAVAWRFDPAGGYLAAAADGAAVLVEAPPAGPWAGVNDGRSAGVAGFGVHVARREAIGWTPPEQEPTKANPHMRHLDSCHRHDQQGRDGFGITHSERRNRSGRVVYLVTLGGFGRDLLQLRLQWRTREREASCVADVTVLAAAGLFFKEPKWSFNGLRGFGDSATVRDAHGTKLGTVDLSRYTNPRRSTRQLQQAARRHVELRGPNGVATLTAAGLREKGQAVDWTAATGSLEGWRRHARTAPRLTDQEDAPYCHSRTLRATWELVRWPDSVAMLGHAWTGGVGFHDCPNGYCAAPPAGTRYRTWLRIRFA